MVEFRPLLISFILLGIFSVALINIIYFVQIDNGADETIMDSKYGLNIYKENITTSINKGYNDISDADNSTSGSPITLSSGSPFLDAISGVWKTVKTAPITVYKLTLGLAYEKLFYNSEGRTEGILILTAIVSIITLTIIFAAWKMIATGDAG